MNIWKETSEHLLRLSWFADEMAKVELDGSIDRAHKLAAAHSVMHRLLQDRWRLHGMMHDDLSCEHDLLFQVVSEMDQQLTKAMGFVPDEEGEE